MRTKQSKNMKALKSKLVAEDKKSHCIRLSPITESRMRGLMQILGPLPVTGLVKRALSQYTRGDIFDLAVKELAERRLGK